MTLGRRLVSFLLPFSLAASALVPHHVQAWHAVPHMIIGAIARMNMSELAQSKIEYILGLWRGQYPKQCTLERATVWLDNIGLKEGSGTDVTRRFDFVKLFSHMHGANIPWNPQNIKLRGLDAHLPIYERTALFLLDNAYNSLLLTTTSMEKFEDPHCVVPPLTPLGPVEVPGAVQLAAASEQPAAVAPSEDESSSRGQAVSYSSSFSSRRHAPPYRPKNWTPPVEIPGGVGSIFSLNLHLRLILHLLPDIHQPLHSMIAFYKAFPRGDMWGSNVTMKMPDGVRTTLHRFWDSAAFQYTKQANEVMDDEIMEEAQKIIKEFPLTRMMNHFIKPLLAPHFSNIADESYTLGTTFVYRELNLAKLKYSDLPYRPSQEYIEEAQVIARQQLALAGYRLAHCLEVLSAYLPYPGMAENDEPI